MTAVVAYVLALVIGLVAIATVGPLLFHQRFRTVREPTETETELLEAVWPSFSDQRPPTQVIETVGERSIELSIRGPPGFKVLFVTDYVLHEIDREHVRALIAGEMAREQLYYTEYRVIAAALALGLGTSAFLLIIPFSYGFGALLVLAAAMLAGGRWLQYRADAIAGDEVGNDALAAAFAYVADLRGIEPKSGGASDAFSVQPTLGDRIERLRDRT